MPRAVSIIVTTYLGAEDGQDFGSVPLPSRFAWRLLTRVFRERVRAGFHAGLIAAAATGGALVAFGMGLHHPWLPFNLAAHVLLGFRASVVNELHPFITPVGVLVHLAALMIWAVMFAVLVGPRRFVVTGAAAAAFAAIVFALNTRIFPVALRPGYESVLTTGQMVFLHFLLAVTLALGIRIAFSRRVVT